MNDRVFYDMEANVISLDLSNASLSKEFLDQLVKDVQEVASVLPEKLHAIMYWHKTVVPEDMHSYLSGIFSRLAEYVQSLQRYSSIEPLPFRIVETPVGKRVFNSGHRCKEAALAAIRVEEENHRIILPSAFRRTPEEVEESLASIFTPEQLAAAAAADLSNLANLSPSLSETLNEDREDRV
jgi:hypothetical protein